MELKLDLQLAVSYKSQSQKMRVLTEQWVGESIFCPNCGQLHMDKYPNNQPVADFYCRNCREDYELKSKQNTLGSIIADGAYQKKLERLTSGSNNPNLFLFNYESANFEVTNFLVIPKQFFVPAIIERRKPLAPTARRAGWVGSNILLRCIPQRGRIFFVRDRRIEPKEKVLNEWRRTLFLREEKEVSARGWLLDIMRCIDELDKNEFSLNEVYAFENELSKLYSDNKHIKDKIRQQLQFLRDKDYLEFLGQGRYRLV